MWTNELSSDIIPQTPNYGTLKGNSRSNGKTPKNHKSDSRMQIQILLTGFGQKIQTMGTAMRRLHQIQKNQ